MSLPPLVEPGPPLSRDQVERYSRHLLLPQIGETGQRRLRRARVCVIGAGGLGAPVLQYLTAAGVGRLGIVDMDVVEVHNLQRQVVHGWADVGRPKVDSARDAVRSIDQDVEVVLHPVRLSVDNAQHVLGGYDLVLDGTDNFATRYLVNDVCAALGLPLVWASIFQFDAQVSVFWSRPPVGAPAVQLRDLFPTPPPPGSVPSCAEGGVLGALCGQVGSVMAMEAIKLITGVGESLLGRVLVIDARSGRWTDIPLRPDPARSAGRVRPAPDAVDGCRSGAPDRGDTLPTGAVLTATELRDRLAARADGTETFELVDVRQPGEHAIVAIPGSRLVPLGALLAAPEIPGTGPDTPVVLYCRSGVRSAQAWHVLRGAGYQRVQHLDGGVLSWVAEVDPALPTY